MPFSTILLEMTIRYRPNVHGHGKEFRTRPLTCECAKGKMYIGMPAGYWDDEPSYDYKIDEACEGCPSNPYKGIKFPKSERFLERVDLKVRKYGYHAKEDF